MITLIPLKNGYWAYYNGINVGDILCDVDGYYKWFPKDLGTKGGYITEHFLFAMGDKLEELNAPYDAELAAFFAGCRTFSPGNPETLEES